MVVQSMSEVAKSLFQLMHFLLNGMQMLLTIVQVHSTGVHFRLDTLQLILSVSQLTLAGLQSISDFKHWILTVVQVMLTFIHDDTFVMHERVKRMQ
ncbi:MAG TPA: hypothetical protein DDW85_12315 [Porphyromonadaceae bacterium]|nr:hypothetical protein [Porphyromonadaceae bacterium]